MSQSNDDPAHRYANERRRVKSSDLSETDTEAVLEFLSALDPDDLTHIYTNDKGEQETLAHSSLQDYGRALRQIADEIEPGLLEATTEDLRAGFNTMLERDANQTVRQRQAAVRKFYRYHDTGVVPEEIPLVKVNKSSEVDERTTLTRDDVQALRDACDNLRDRAMLEMFVYTGLRLRALQTIRLGDINLEEGVYYLNTDEAGLKNADKVGGKRPLLGAEKAVRQWINQGHPTGDPDDYLITALPSATGAKEPGQYLSKIAIYNRLDKLFKTAEVDRPKGQMAHAFRHYFVTVAIRDYDMDPATVKYLIGHAPKSTVMETTYSHLTDQDHVDAARAATGITNGQDEEDEGTAHTPETCPTCSEPLPPAAKACPDCGMVFTPDAVQAQSAVQQAIGHDRALAALDGDEVSEEVLEAIAQDDATLARLIEMRAEK